jgi:hypothetical protein
VPADHVDAALGEEPRVTADRLHLARRRTAGVDRPEADGLAVAQGEVARRGALHEARLAGRLLVEPPEVEERLGAEVVVVGLERPGAGLREPELLAGLAGAVGVKGFVVRQKQSIAVVLVWVHRRSVPSGA